MRWISRLRDRAINCLCPITAVLLFGSLQPAFAAATDAIELELPLGRSWDLATSTGRSFARVAASPEEDLPLAPSVTWWWHLEAGERIASAELLPGEESVLGVLTREPKRLPLLGSESGPVREAGKEALWSSAFTLDVSPPRVLHGQCFQAITLTPIRSEAGRLFGLKSASLRIHPAPTQEQGGTQPLRPDFPARERILGLLGESLLNPESLPPAQDRAVGGSGFPTEVPSIEGAAVDMVIVTVDSFADLCQSYADQRTNFGIATVVRTVEWIAERYPLGSDRAEMIRTFIQDAYAKWSIRYVLLAGDVAQIPTRFAYNHVFYDPRTNPTDLYYACMDGDWNADHDALWAEAADSSENDPGDEADLLPELAVGRLPASQRDECGIMLEKSRTYHDAQNHPYQDRLLMLAEVLFPVDWDGNPGSILLDAAAHCELLRSNYMDANQHVVRLYENHQSYPGSLPLTVSAAHDSMSNGFGIVIHNGHGARQTMSLGSGAIQASEMRDLDNGDNTFMIWLVNCTAGAFDLDCMAETLIELPAGGAFGVIGSTRETFPTVSQGYVETNFEHLKNDPEMRLGDVYQAAMVAHEPSTLQDNAYRWAQTTITLLADPSLWLRYKRVTVPVVDAPNSLPAHSGPLNVAIDADSHGAPLPDALVTLRKANEEYLRGLTDAGGLVSFDLNPENTGVYQIRVDARDIVPAFDGCQVTLPASGPLLSLSAIAVDDVTDGTVSGNGNGIAERGETIRLALTLRNSALVGASSVNGILHTSHPELVLIDATDSYGSLPAGTSHAGAGGYLVQILDAEDDAILDFELEIQCTAGVYYDDFFLEAASPRLALYRSQLIDAGGDGDGVLEVGETADLHVELANYGRAVAQGVLAELVAPTCPGCSGISVQSGEVDLDDLAALSTGLGPASFNIRRISSLPPLVNLHLTDMFGHADTLSLLLVRPQSAPGAPSGQYGAEYSRLVIQWEPPITADAAAYVVLRANGPGGPYQEISEHNVMHASFEDSGLDAYTSYWYKTQALSAAGLAGPNSAATELKTQPAQLAGWPVTLGAETSSTPVVADVDGDGDYEIIVAADVIYGFHADGSELSDGDNDPDTKGPVFNVAGGFGGALAAGDLTANPGMEVVAVGWNTQKVYLLEFDAVGDDVVAHLAPGWPKSVAHNVGIWASPSLGDVDGDQKPEIFVTETGGSACLMAWHSNGSEVADGDHIPATQGIFHTDMGYWPRSTAAFGHADADNDMEIFVGTGKYHGYLKGFDGDGSQLPGFPVRARNQADEEYSAIFSSPAIGDLDGDAWPEIVFPAENDSLYVLDHNGRRHPGWPIYLESNNWSLAPSVALADLTGDGRPEIFVSSVADYEIADVGWLDIEGHWLPGWPQQASFSSTSSPVVGDIDGDGEFEVLLGNEFAQIEAWHRDGTHVLGFPLVLGNAVRATPSLLDVDQDGFMDLITAGWDRNVYVWTFPNPYERDKVPWYTFMHDQGRTGNFATEDWVVPVQEPDDGSPGAPSLSANWPNPFNPSTQIRFHVTGTPQRVRLSILDVSGRHIADLTDQVLSPGTYQSAWTGIDSEGRPVASGIYFARLSVGDQVETRKMTMVK